MLGNWLRLSAMAAGIFVCASGMYLQAQALGVPPQAKTMLVEPPAPLLPATLGKLKRAAEGDVGDGLGSLDPVNAAVLREDGLKRFARSDYGNSNGKDFWPFLNVTVYQFVDASGAIAAYDYFKKSGMRSEKVGDDSVSNPGELLIRSGKNVVVSAGASDRFKLSRDITVTAMSELIGHLPKAQGPAALNPLLPSLLPAKGFDSESVKYALGPAGYSAMGGVLPADVVGFDKSAETVTAKYKNGGILTMLLYPTPQIAGEHGRAIEALMNQRVASGDATTRAAIGTVMMRREGPLVVMTTGAWAASDAKKMVDGIHLESQVTFDKPMPVEFHAEVKKTYSLLVSIGLFCGIALVAMLVLGAFFGGGRALIRVMQGKPAASEPEFLHIDLSGPGGKRLRGPEA
ncbi:MAG: hypothetical protein M3O31_04825 [Acidobacteriota bacterium]|nr:hypothetical protein [Acidobacteriota bacterium]